MKIFLRIVGVITVLFAIFFYSLTTYCAQKEGAKSPTSEEVTLAKDILQKQLTAVQEDYKSTEDAFQKSSDELEIEDLKSKLAEDYTTKGTYNIILALSIILVAISLVLGIFLFIPKPKVATILLVLTIVLAIIPIVLSPNVKFSHGASTGVLAKIAIVPAILSALFVFILARKGAKPRAI